MLTDADNSFTVGNSNKLSTKWISHKNLVALPCETKKIKCAFALPILVDKAMPNFYRKFVNR